jgi:hypothetical protein
MLVLGDSILWGQGLLDGDKPWALVQQQLRSALHATVNPPQVFAHSGACIAPDAAKDAAPALWGEVPSFYPSITAQVDAAASDYKNVDLILLDGGSNDLGIKRLVDPLARGAPISQEAQHCCGLPMQSLLGKVLKAFPRAGVVVTGYYPIVSNLSGPGGIGHLLGAFGMQGTWEKIVASILGDIEASLIFQLLRHKLANLSTAWADTSTQALRGAIAAANAAQASAGQAQRAVFAPIVFQPENCLECAQTSLWVGVDDDLRQKRLDFCAKSLPAEIDWQTQMEIPIASLGHPNRAGAKTYAQAVMQALSPWMAGGTWVPGPAPATTPTLDVSVENAPLVQPNQPAEARVTVRALDAQTKLPVRGQVEMTNYDSRGVFQTNQPFSWPFHAHTFDVPEQGTTHTTTRMRVLADGYDPVWVRW